MISNQVSIHGEVNRCRMLSGKFAINPALHLDQQQGKAYKRDRAGDNTEYIPAHANWLVETPIQVSGPDTRASFQFGKRIWSFPIWQVTNSLRKQADRAIDDCPVRLSAVSAGRSQHSGGITTGGGCIWQIVGKPSAWGFSPPPSAEDANMATPATAKVLRATAMRRAMVIADMMPFIVGFRQKQPVGAV
ncbi:hypothetical protein ACLMAJ_31030 [Nocardia sp. KC 131]|uniref:hypothetical protein n=1 Tax=Nocardia arseniciresistens TaxID=3392119 RepID=UPI00398E7A21